MINPYRYVVAGGGLPLDGITAPLVYVSLDKVITAYAGNCIKVRRSSDSLEADIGFSGDYLDTTALATHLGADQGYITTWYDQSGNGYDLTQATASVQPEIITSTDDGSKKAIKFNGDALWNNCGSGAADFTTWPRDYIFVGYQTTNSWQIAASMAISSTGSNYNLCGGIVFYSAAQRFYIGTPATFDSVTPTTAILNNMHLFHNYRDATDTDLDVDDGDATTNRTPNITNYSNNAYIILGAQNGTTGSSGFVGEISEYGIWAENGLTSGEKSTVRGEIMTRYSI